MMSGLQRLLELEAALAERLAAARTEADRILAEARADAEAARDQAERLARAEEERLVAELTADRARLVAELEADLERRSHRYQALAPAEVEAIARSLLDSLLELPDSGRSS